MEISSSRMNLGKPSRFWGFKSCVHSKYQQETRPEQYINNSSEKASYAKLRISKKGLRFSSWCMKIKWVFQKDHCSISMEDRHRQPSATSWGSASHCPDFASISRNQSVIGPWCFPISSHRFWPLCPLQSAALKRIPVLPLVSSSQQQLLVRHPGWPAGHRGITHLI